MKNLATCKPTEFFKQTVKIKKAVEKWLTDTDIMNIRKNVATPSPITKDMTDEEKRAAVDDFRKRSEEQAMANMSKILDAIMEEHPDETINLLALMCFIDPKDADNYSMDEYLKALTEMITNEAVIGFFTSLARLGLFNTSN